MRIVGQRPPIHKRKYLVNFKFQADFIKKSLVVAAGLIIVQWCTLQIIFVRFNLYGEDLPHELKVKFYDILNHQIDMLNQSFLWMCILTPIILFVWGIFQSHRIAGPLHNIKLKLKEIRGFKNTEELTKNITETQFRRSDYFHELAKEYNETVKHLIKINADATSEENTPEVKPHLQIVKPEAA
jgi:hypothetical protein